MILMVESNFAYIYNLAVLSNSLNRGTENTIGPIPGYCVFKIVQQSAFVVTVQKNAPEVSKFDLLATLSAKNSEQLFL